MSSVLEYPMWVEPDILAIHDATCRVSIYAQDTPLTKERSFREWLLRRAAAAMNMTMNFHTDGMTRIHEEGRTLELALMATRMIDPPVGKIRLIR